MNITPENTVVQIAPSAPSMPSIASSAMLVELNISTWAGRKKDKTESAKTNYNAGATAGTAAVTKKLLGNCEELTALQKHVSSCRSLHTSMTLPWSDSGLRLIPTAQYFKYQQAMTDMQQQFDKLTEEFIDAYAWEVTTAHRELGDMFHRDEYPTSDALAGKFRMRMNYLPVPEAGDFRVDVGAGNLAELQDHYESYYTAQLSHAMTHLWNRLFESLTRMSERLDYTDTKKVFRNSLVENVVEIVELLGTCNITNDTQMSAMQSRLEVAMYGVTPEALRDDSHLRRIVREDINEAIAAIDNLPSLSM